MYYSAQNIIQKMVERLMQREMNAIYLCIRNQLTKVEVTVDNMAWVVSDDLAQPDSMFVSVRQFVDYNPAVLGSGITFVPDYYPQKGRWFEPYAVRRDDGTIETMQLASADHDYLQMEFFTTPIAKNCGHWCEPYMDKDGAKAMVTTYSIPVHDTKGETVAVFGADISLDWLDGVMEESKLYESTQRFLVTDAGHLLAGEDNTTFRNALHQLNTDGDNEGYVIMTNEKGEKLHVFYHPIGGITNWVLINILHDNEVFGKLRIVRISLLLMALAGLLLIGFIVWRTSRNIERLRRVNAEKERIDSELSVARKIQKEMIPKTFPPYPDRDDIDVYSSLVPAREVGGDLLDYFIRDEKLFFCIGDVSGKGVPSAMLMAVIHSLFRAFSAHESNPARIMQAINEASCQGNESNMFVTMFIGVLDLPTGRLRYCDAGHDAPLIIDHSCHSAPQKEAGQCSMLNVTPNLPLGVFDDLKYGLQEMQMPTDSTLFLYTDGLTEAKRAPKQMFGLQRTKEVICKCAQEQLKPQQILEAISEEVERFIGDAEQSDDLTMIAIRFTSKHFDSIMDETLILKNDIHEVTKLSTFIKTMAERLNIEKSLARQLRLAVEEAVVNVMEYAYPPGTEGDLEIRMMSDGNSLKIMIIDSGVPFDPTAKKKADTTLSAEDRNIGGLGILLVRELMDIINYEREEGRNILTLIKTINK